MARGDVVGAAAIELAVAHTVAQVGAIVVKDKTVAQHDDLAAKRQVHTVLAQHREQLPGPPAGEGFVKLGGALGAVGQPGCVAIAPGTGTHQVGRAIHTAQVAQALVNAQAVLDERLTPGGAAAAPIVVLRAIEHTVHGEEVAGDLSVGVGIQLNGLRLAHQQCHAQADRLAQAAVFQCVLHCY